MIKIQYVDYINKNQLFCGVQILKETNVNEYSQLLLSRWLGNCEDLISARGELMALAAVSPEHRSDVCIVNSTNSFTDIDDVLLGFRSRFPNLQFANVKDCISCLLDDEILLFSNSNERVVADRIMAKHLPSIFYKAQDKDLSLEVNSDSDELPLDKIILCLVSPPSKIHGFRLAKTKNHFRAIIKQALENDLLVYYSNFVEDGKELVAEGPWVLLPSSYFSFNDKIKVEDEPSLSSLSVDVVEEHNLKPSVIDDVEPSNTIHTPDGLVCAWCDREFKKRFGLTNHIKAKHPEHFEEYKNFE